MIPLKQFEVIFHNIPFSPISTIDLSSDLINFEENIINFLISLWIRPLFTNIPLNLNYFDQIGKFGIIFDTRPCEIDDLTVTSRQAPSTLSSRSLTSVSLLIICANALIKGSTEGAGGGIAGGGVIVRGGLEAKGVGLGFPICCCTDPKA